MSEDIIIRSAIMTQPQYEVICRNDLDSLIKTQYFLYRVFKDDPSSSDSILNFLSTAGTVASIVGLFVDLGLASNPITITGLLTTTLISMDSQDRETTLYTIEDGLLGFYSWKDWLTSNSNIYKIKVVLVRMILDTNLGEINYITHLNPPDDFGKVPGLQNESTYDCSIYRKKFQIFYNDVTQTSKPINTFGISDKSTKDAAHLMNHLIMDPTYVVDYCKEFQSRYNIDFLPKIKLVEDGIYGPKTQQAITDVKSVIYETFNL